MHKKELRELLCAMLIGDGSMHLHKATRGDKTYEYTRYSIGHSINQEDYLLWKLNKLNTVFEEKGLREKVKANYYSATTKGKTYPTVNFAFSSPFLKELRERFYKNGKKNVEKLLEQMHSPLHLALWFMDDGNEDRSYTKSRADKNKKYKRSPRFRLAVCELTEGEINLAVQWFQSKFKITPRTSQLKGGPVFRFSVRDSAKLFKIMLPYLSELNSMHTKFRWSFDLLNNDLTPTRNTPDKGEDIVQTTTLV